MRLTKDEASILSKALDEAKYHLVDYMGRDQDKRLDLTRALSQLQERLEEFGVDNRRFGRTSLNSWNDTFRRFIKRHKENS